MERPKTAVWAEMRIYGRIGAVIKPVSSAHLQGIDFSQTFLSASNEINTIPYDTIK